MVPVSYLLVHRLSISIFDNMQGGSQLRPVAFDHAAFQLEVLKNDYFSITHLLPFLSTQHQLRYFAGRFPDDKLNLDHLFMLPSQNITEISVPLTVAPCFLANPISNLTTSVLRFEGALSVRALSKCLSSWRSTLRMLDVSVLLEDEGCPLVTFLERLAQEVPLLDTLYLEYVTIIAVSTLLFLGYVF